MYRILPTGKPRVDDRRVISGIVYVLLNGIHAPDRLLLSSNPVPADRRHAADCNLGCFDHRSDRPGILPSLHGPPL